MSALDFRIKKPTVAAGTIAATEIWPVNLAATPPKPALRLLSCAPANASATLPAYAVYLSYLLGGRLSHLVLPEKDALTAVENAARRNDLIILDEPAQSLATRLCLGRPGAKFAAHTPTSVLVARQPLWPLRRLLLVLRLDGSDETAIFWTKRLAQTSGATVTILPLIPTLPAMYAPQPNGVSALLSSQTTAGQQVRQAVHQFNDAQVTAVIRLRQGEPGEQIHSEVADNLYDMVLIGAEPEGRWQRWLLGNLVTPLLCWITQSVLVARPSARLSALI